MQSQINQIYVASKLQVFLPKFCIRILLMLCMAYSSCISAFYICTVILEPQRENNFVVLYKNDENKFVDRNALMKHIICHVYCLYG
jgi:hypothetical protein